MFRIHLGDTPSSLSDEDFANLGEQRQVVVIPGRFTIKRGFSSSAWSKLYRINSINTIIAIV